MSTMFPKTTIPAGTGKNERGQTGGWVKGIGNNVSGTLNGVNVNDAAMPDKLDRKMGKLRAERLKARQMANRGEMMPVKVPTNRELFRPQTAITPRCVEIPKPPRPSYKGKTYIPMDPNKANREREAAERKAVRDAAKAKLTTPPKPVVKAAK